MQQRIEGSSLISSKDFPETILIADVKERELAGQDRDHALEELAAELILQASDLRAHRGLRESELARRAREVALLGDGEEAPEVTDLHLHSLDLWK